MTSLPWLTVDGTQIVDPTGKPVLLRGVGLGGWMNMENFITGYAGNEAGIRSRLQAAMSPAAFEAFFETFYTDFFAEDDAEYLASLGVNSVRIPVNYHHFEDDSKPFELIESGFARLDRVVTLLGQHGIYSIIDLHAVPGRQNHHWHSDNPTHEAGFWQHPHFQDRVVNLWEAMADRFRDRPEIAGFNPINEPADETGEVLPAFYRRIEEAIRAIDPKHTLFLDGNKYSTDFSCFGDPFDNTVFASHDYALPGITSATEYPGYTRGEYFDRGVLEKEFLRRTEYMRNTNTPIWIGEFGPMYPQDRPGDTWRYDLLQDQLDIYREHDASWALWTYKDIGLQGLASAHPDSPYMTLTESVRSKKHRVGADSWGGVDTGIRDVLDPIDALFDKEFPGYDPYPWGRRQHINVLVRHILFAEPVADEYAALFAGKSADEARELAHSFRFDRCHMRTDLADLVRSELVEH